MAKQKKVSKLSRCARALNAALAHYFAEKCGANEEFLLTQQQSKKPDEGMNKAHIYLCEDEGAARNFYWYPSYNEDLPVNEDQCQLDAAEEGQDFYIYVRLSQHSGFGFAYSDDELPSWPLIDGAPEVSGKFYSELSDWPLDTMLALRGRITEPMLRLLERNSNLLDFDFFSRRGLYMFHPRNRRKKGKRLSAYGMLSWRRPDSLSRYEIERDAKIFMNFGNVLSDGLRRMFYYNGFNFYEMLESGKIESLKGLCAPVQSLDISMLYQADPDAAALIDDDMPLTLGVIAGYPVEDESTFGRESNLPLYRGWDWPNVMVLLEYLYNMTERTFIENDRRYRAHDRITALPENRSIIQGTARSPDKVLDFTHALTLSADGFALNRRFTKNFRFAEYYRQDGITKLITPRECELEVKPLLGLYDYQQQKNPIKKGFSKPISEQQLLAYFAIHGKNEFTPADESSAYLLDFLESSFHTMLRLINLKKVRHEMFTDSHGKMQRILMPSYVHSRYFTENQEEMAQNLIEIYTLGLRLRELAALNVLQLKLDKKADELSCFALGELWLSWLLTQTVQIYVLADYNPQQPVDRTFYWYFDFSSLDSSNKEALQWITLLWPDADSFWFGDLKKRLRLDDLGYDVEKDDKTLREHYKNFGFAGAYGDRCLTLRPSKIKAAVPAMFCLSSDDMARAASPEGLLLDGLSAARADSVYDPRLPRDPDDIPVDSDHYFVKGLFDENVMTERLQGLTLHLPAVERQDSEISLLPCYILFYKDGSRRVITVKQLFDENRSDSMLFDLIRGEELYHFLSFSEFLPDGLELRCNGFDYCCELDQFEAVIDSMNEYCTTVPCGGEYPQYRFKSIPLYTVASSNIKTLELTDVLYIDLPNLVNLQTLPDNYIDLESMLQFDWKLAVGKDTLSEEDFEKLRQNSGKIVKLHDKFVRADERKLKSYREKIDRLDRMNRHLLLLATLTGSYDGSDVVVGRKLEEARASIFASGDSAVPTGLTMPLRHYQVLGYTWLLRNARSGIGSILADDMGLGKTIQLIAVLLKLKEENELYEHPALIVVPSSVLINWRNEIKRFAPELNVYIYHGDRRSHENLTDSDVILSTYGTVRTSYKKINGITYSIIAVDEAQKIKNYASQSVKALKALKGRRYVALTGTPVENRLSEYWSIMDFVNPGLLGARTRFNAEIAVPIEKYRDPLALARFKRITGPFILRRLKTDKNIISDLPDKIVTDEFCSLTPAQVTLYQAVLDDIMKRIRETSMIATIERSALVLQLINSLKQICNSPLQYVSGRDIANDYTAEDSGKVRHLFSLAGRLMGDGHRTLIFTQYTTMGELLQKWLKKELGVEVPFIRGSLSPRQRQDIVDKFQSYDPQKDKKDPMPFLLLSLKAGGTGINLTKADAVIHFDLWWNPAVEEQATDRAYRIGQNNNVQVFRFITANTFEEKINAIIQSKKELSDLTVVSGSKWLGELSNDELADLFALTREDLG